MFGWSRRCFPTPRPFFLPGSLKAGWPYLSSSASRSSYRGLGYLVCLILTYLLTVAIRLMELPYWHNEAYQLGNEFLLATHDAYHWIAGAEGFEFGEGHPMSELVKWVGDLLGVAYANAGFWLPPFLGGLTAIAVYLWGAGLGYPLAAMCAGILSSLSPIFLARTMLGFYDTDLIVLPFAILIGLVPALWVHPWLASFPDFFAERILGLKRKFTRSHRSSPLKFFRSDKWQTLQVVPRVMERDILSWPWLLALMLWGIFGYYTQEWHSLFPYLIRYSCLCLPLLILVLGPAQGRFFLLQGAFCHALPLISGPSGLLAALVYSFLVKLIVEEPSKEEADSSFRKESRALWYNFLLFIKWLINKRSVLFLLWALVIILCLDSQTLYIMKKSFSSYVFRSGDVVAGAKSLLFPSVTKSIIEIQTVSPNQLIAYLYPDKYIVFISLAMACLVFLTFPVLIWFLPLLVLSFLSLYMGGRMTMFGPPILMLSLTIGGTMVIGFIWKLALFLWRNTVRQIPVSSFWEKFPNYFLTRTVFGIFATRELVWPLLLLIPAYTQGPIISQDHAAGLAYIKEHSPEDSIVWNWWDWGYAAHHFSQRVTIADGARHGGPALFLPALVYTTDDPRFARQVIKYTAQQNNRPAEVFAGLKATEVATLLDKLKDKEGELIEDDGNQYLVVSFELLRIGLWITRYGTWDFETESSDGAIINNIYQGLEIDLKEGWVATDSGHKVNASSIDLFSKAGIDRFNFPDNRGNHFVFNMESHAKAADLSRKADDPLVKFWEKERGVFSFNSPSNDKLAMDLKFYNSVMVQLLLSDEDDPRISPYFKCIFNNFYTKVFKVL